VLSRFTSQVLDDSLHTELDGAWECIYINVVFSLPRLPHVLVKECAAIISFNGCR